MKKIRLFTLLALPSCCLTACGGSEYKAEPDFKASDVKVGLICLHGDYSTYDANFIEAMNATGQKLGFTPQIVEDIEEGQPCYDKAVELAELGCNIIFADSFGHEPYMIDAAKVYKNTLFCHATGTSAASENLENFGDAFASIYEGRYLAGVAGGLKLAALYGDGNGANVSAENAKVGYVGAFTYAEIISGFTSFFLGVRSVVPNATMQVKYSGSWYDENAERTIANELINDYGCKLISQHADSHGAPQACEAAGVPNVSYNGSTLSDGPNTYLINYRINWAPYYEHVINNYVKQRQEGKKRSVENDFAGTLKDGSVVIDSASSNCPAGAQDTLDAVKAELVAGTRHVFDTSTFTVGGEAPSASNMKPGEATWPNFPSKYDLLKDGYYHESEFRSAPSFDVIIDGITNINVNFGD